MIFTNHQTQAFVYRWTNLATGQWYIGSRTAQGCHPEDGYICSSRRIKPLIESNQTSWHREILCIGEPAEMIELETRLLQSLDAKNDPLSYNQHNGDGKFTTAGVEPHNKGKTYKRGTPSWNSGKPNPKHSEAMKGRTPPNKGKPSPRKGIPNPGVSQARKSLPKDVCRLFDCREMSMIYYNQWIDKVENPEKWTIINTQKSIKQKGRKQSAEWIEKRIASRLNKTKGP